VSDTGDIKMSTYFKAMALFNAKPELLDVALETVSFWTETELEQRHDELMDDTLPEVTIGSYTYSPSHVLREVDPIAYRQEVLSYIANIDMVEVEDYYFDEAELQEFIEQHTANTAI
jgi:hypothetical protein